MNKVQVGAIALIAILAAAGGLVYYQYFMPNASGEIYYNILVTYSDGTSETLDQTPAVIPPFSVSPLAITYNNKQVSGLTFNLYAKLDSAKPITAWQILGVQHLEAYLNGQQVPATGSTKTIQGSGGAAVNGQAIFLSSTALTSEQIATALQTSGGAGTWAFQCVASLNAAFTFSDGEIRNVNALAPVAGISYNFDGTLSIAINPANI